MIVPELPPMEEPKAENGIFTHSSYLFYIWLMIAVAIFVPLLFIYGARAHLGLIWIPVFNMCITYSALFFTIRAWRRNEKLRIYLGFATMVASFFVSTSAYSMAA
jgi:hypothetical protein